MPYYEFKNESGEVLRKFFESERVPPYGKIVTIDGHEKCYRIAGAPNIKAPRPTPSYTCPAWTPGADNYLDDGTPCFSSDEKAKRAAKSLGYVERSE